MGYSILIFIIHFKIFPKGYFLISHDKITRELSARAMYFVEKKVDLDDTEGCVESRKTRIMTKLVGEMVKKVIF